MRALHVPVSGPVQEVDLTFDQMKEMIGTDSLEIVFFHNFLSVLKTSSDNNKNLPLNPTLQAIGLFKSFYEPRGDGYLISHRHDQLINLDSRYSVDNWESVLVGESVMVSRYKAENKGDMLNLTRVERNTPSKDMIFSQPWKRWT